MDYDEDYDYQELYGSQFEDDDYVEDPYKTNVDDYRDVDRVTDEEFIKMFMEKKPKGEAQLKIKKLNKKMLFEIIKEPIEEKIERTGTIEILEDDTDLPPQLEYSSKYVSKETDLPPYFRSDIKMYDRVMFNYQNAEGIIVAISPEEDITTIYNIDTQRLETYKNEDIYNIEIKSTEESNFKDEEDKRFFIYKDNKVDITLLDKSIEDERIGKYTSFKLYRPKSVVGKVIGSTNDDYIIYDKYTNSASQVNYKDPTLVLLKKDYEESSGLLDDEDKLESKVSSSLRKYCFNYIYSKLIDFIPDTISTNEEIDIPELPEKDIMILNLGVVPFKEYDIEWDDERKAFILKWEFDGESIEEVIKYNGEIVEDLESHSDFIILRSQIEERGENNFYNLQLKYWLHSDKYHEFYDKVFNDKEYVEEKFDFYVKQNLDYISVITSLLTRYGKDFLRLSPEDMVDMINQEPNQHSFDVFLKMGLIKFPNYTSNIEEEKAKIITDAFFNFINSKEKDPIVIKQNIIDKKVYQLIEEYKPTKDDINRFEKQYLDEIKEIYKHKFNMYLKSLSKKQKLDDYIDKNIKNKTDAKIAKNNIIKEIYNNMGVRGDFELTWKGLKILEDVKKLEEQIYSVSFFEPIKYISRIIEPIIFFDESDFKNVTQYYQQSLKSSNIDIKNLIDLTLLEYFPELLLNKKNLNEDVWEFLMKKIRIIKENALEDFIQEYLNSKYFGKTRNMKQRKLTVFKWGKGDDDNTNYLISVIEYCKLNTKNSNVGNYPLHNIYLYYDEVEDKVECYLLDKVFNSIEKGEENNYPNILVSKIKDIIRNKEGVLDKKSKKIIFTKKNQILNNEDLGMEINYSDITVILIYNDDPESLKFYDIWNDFFYGRPYIINYAEIFIPQYDNPKNLLKSYRIPKRQLPVIIILNQQGELLRKMEVDNLTKYRLIGLIQNTLDD